MTASKKSILFVVGLALLSVFGPIQIGLCAFREDTLTPEDLILGNQNSEIRSVGRDIQILKYALEGGYVGFEFLDPRLKNSTFDQIQLLSKKSDTLSAKDLCDKLGNILSKIPDSHLQSRLNNHACPLTEKTTRKPSVGSNYGLKSVKKSTRSWSISHVEVGGIEFPVISLFRFPNPKHPAWEGFDSSFLGALKAKAIILDLRGNEGGDDAKAFEIAKILIGAKFQTPQEYKKTRLSLVSRALFLNKVLAEISDRKKSGSVVPQVLIDEERTRRLDFEKARLQPKDQQFETVTFPDTAPQTRTMNFNGPIIVLIDADCGSTGELLALALKNSPNVTLVGENSAGYLHFGNPGLLVLPHTNIQVEIPTTFKKFRKLTWLEKIGIAPDIQVSSGQDALELAKKEVMRVTVK